jgi:hypothetical protein
MEKIRKMADKRVPSPQYSFCRCVEISATKTPMVPHPKYSSWPMAAVDATSDVCISSPVNVYSSRTEAKRCPSLPYRWPVSPAVSAFGTMSLERCRPSTQPRKMTETPCSVALANTDFDLRPALPLRQFQAEIRLSAVGSGCDKSGSLSDRGQNSLELDPYLRHVRLRSRVCQPGCCP